MKQQMYEVMLQRIVNTTDQKELDNLKVKAAILLKGGDKSASVIKELINSPFEPRDPENMDPYGPQNHPLNPPREPKVM